MIPGDINNHNKVYLGAASPNHSIPTQKERDHVKGLRVGTSSGKRIVDEFHYLQNRLKNLKSPKSSQAFEVPLENTDLLKNGEITAEQWPDGTVAFSIFQGQTDHSDDYWVYNDFLDMSYSNDQGVIEKETHYNFSMYSVESEGESPMHLRDYNKTVTVNEATGEILSSDSSE